MNDIEVKTLKAQIQQEERLYLIELKKDQRFEKLKAIRLKINKLRQEITAHEQEPPEGVSPLV